MRGTCAVARVCMQIYDEKLKTSLVELCVRIWMMKRYMDDTRIFLPPFKLGWRMVAGSLCYSRGWELEDAMKNQSGEQRTKEILLQIMNQVEDYLTFTAEIGEEFEGGGYPPLI